MPSPTLFSYTVESDGEDALVITVRGTLAQTLIHQLQSGTSAGGPALATLLSPIAAIGGAVSKAVHLSSPAVQEGEGGDVGSSPLSQEVDQAYAAFQQQLEGFRQSLDELKAAKPPAGRKADKA
jgi:hypothetical protein